MKADLFGTNLLTPMVTMLEKYYKKQKNRILNVFVLTDGELDPDPIFKLIESRRSSKFRVYTIGIGKDVN